MKLRVPFGIGHADPFFNKGSIKIFFIVPFKDYHEINIYFDQASHKTCMVDYTLSRAGRRYRERSSEGSKGISC